MTAGTTLALAGDTMLGRKVAEVVADDGAGDLFDDRIVEATQAADLFVLNLECCISDRGEPWPGKRFHFRAPPDAVRTLQLLGVDAVTLGNNHALDFGAEALADTCALLDEVGIVWVGAGPDRARARSARVVETSGFRLGIVGLTDHPEEHAATEDAPGVALAELRSGGCPTWVGEEIAAAAAEADAVLVTPHWGPNMTSAPVPHVRRAADDLRGTAATLVAGHSAHVFHGVEVAPAGDGRALPFLYDLGDLVDDYAVDDRLRNDRGLLWFVTFDDGRPVRLEALPLALDYRFTRPAEGEEAAWIHQRFTSACADMGTEVEVTGEGHLVVDLTASGSAV